MHRLGPSLKLRPVNYECSADLGFLYGVLAHRIKDPDSNISHKALPSRTSMSPIAQRRWHLWQGLRHPLPRHLGSGPTSPRPPLYRLARLVSASTCRSVSPPRHARWMLAELIARHPRR